MGLFGYVNRFPEISHLSELEQWKLLKAADRLVRVGWRSMLALYVGSALLVSVCVGVGVGTTSILGWSKLVGGAASTMVMMVAMFLYQRAYLRQLRRAVQAIIQGRGEHP